jgi:hypothetical protein
MQAWGRLVFLAAASALAGGLAQSAEVGALGAGNTASGQIV